MKKPIRALLATTLLCAAALITPARAAEPAPLQDFFRNPVVSSPTVSPNGRLVAAAVQGGPEGRRRLVVIDLDDITKSKLLASFANADVYAIRWVNDDRIVFTVTDAKSAYAGQSGEGLYAVDREGKAPPRSLIKRRWAFFDAPSTRRELEGSYRFYATLRDGSNDVIVEDTVLNGRYRPVTKQLYRLDTVTAGTQLLTPNAPERSVAWALDDKGMPRIAVSRSGDKTRVFWRAAAADAKWVPFREYGTAAEAVSFVPLGVDRNDVLYVAAPENSKADTTSLLRIDMRAPDAPAKTLIDLEGHDFNGSLARAANGDLLGIHYTAEERGTHWFDPEMKKLQARVDRLLPDTNNQLGCGNCDHPRIVVVAAGSDKQPVSYLTFEVATGTLKPLLGTRPWIKPAAMATREFDHFTARDGLTIPVHVTRLAGSTGPAPTIVLPHGGPWARAAGWNWDAETQFLASRGYVVVEPEFRSSTGFGAKLFRAGWKQWGTTMQDDVTDAPRWAIAQGLADPKRICIAGASYGGYATLMGLIREPALYRCGFEWVGVSDIGLLFSTNSAYEDDVAREFGLIDLIGDPSSDAARFAATSPSTLAAQLHQPLLMAYGGADDRVTIDHGKKMRSALQGHNPNVEWIEYPEEGHGWYLEANRYDFWTRVERFLDKNLKNAP